MQAEGSLAWPGGDWRVSCVGFTLNLSLQSGNLRGLDVFVDSRSSPPCNKTWGGLPESASSPKMSRSLLL